jgi:membrane-bound lytic murein transglycosylase MltF
MLPAIALALAAPAAGQVALSDIEKEHRIHEPWFGDLDGMIERGMLRVLVTFNQTNYFRDGARQRGITYEAFEKFERFLRKKFRLSQPGIDVFYIPVPRDELLPRLLEGQGDMVAANLSVTPERLTRVDFSDPVMAHVKELVVTGPGVPPVDRVEDLSGREVWVRKSSSYHESLKVQNARLRAQGRPSIRIQWSEEALETEDLLEMVHAGLIPATIADSYLLELWGSVFEDLVWNDSVFLRDDVQIAWAFRKGSPKLARVTNDFVKKIRKGTLMGNILYKRYLETNRWVRSEAAGADRKRFDSMVHLFQKFGKQYGLDPLLQAAQGYQESGLDQSVRSPAGAVGVMQLLRSTAASPEVGIPNIEELEPNIEAGNKYMRVLADRYFPDLADDPLEQQLFCLAAYNAGPTRIRRLRKEAEVEGLDPDQWFGNVEVVVAERVGREPVQYVRNIYKYYVAYSLLTAREAHRERAKEKGWQGL